MKIVEIDMDNHAKIIKLIPLLKYKTLERFKDYRGRLLTQRITESTDLSRLKNKSFEGSVFFRCVVPLEIRDPNALYIDCYDNVDRFTEERNRLKDEVDFEWFEFRELEGVSIDGCFFDGLSMPNVVFSEMRLESVSFVNCNLAGADFSGATVTNCNFRGADLEGTHLGAVFKDCNFYNADLRGAEIFGLDADIRQFRDVAELPEGLVRCESCERVLEEEDAQNTDEETLCWDCYETRTCGSCGELSDSELDDEGLCEACRHEEYDDDDSWG